MAGFMDAIRKTLQESTPVTEIADQQTMQHESADVDVTELAISEEPIDELSRRTLYRYRAAAQDSEQKAAKRVNHYMRTLDPDKDEVTALDKADDTRMKRRDGRQLAHDKIMGRARVNAEEVEPIDELSSDTLKDYRKSASKDFNRRRWITTQAKTDADKKARNNRANGIALASDKLKNKARVGANEEVEPIDELSHQTVYNYMKKAKPKAAQHERDEYSKVVRGSHHNDAIIHKHVTKSMNNDEYAAAVAKGKREALDNPEYIHDVKALGSHDRLRKNKIRNSIRLADKKLSGQARINVKEEIEMDEAVDVKDVLKYVGTGAKKFDRKSLIQKKIAANNAKKAETKEEFEVDEGTAAQDSLSPASHSIDDPKSKFAVIQQAIGAMHAMSKDDLVKWFNDTLAQVGHEADKVGNNAASNAATLNMKPSAASSAQEDVEALFAGQDLSEEFKTNATTLFEAAVGARVAEELVRIEEQYEEALSDAISEAVEDLTTQIDRYFDYAVEAWLEENEVAIESALRSELTEEFINGLRNLFLEHNISVPDENVDAIEELAARVNELEEMLDDQIAENIEFKNALLDAEIEDVVESAMDGLTLSQKEKFRTMVESIEFSGDVEELNSKLALIKKTYFTEQKKPVDSNIINESFDDGAPEKVAVSDPNIARYVSAIGRTARRP